MVDDPILRVLDLSQNQSRLPASPSSATILHQRYLLRASGPYGTGGHVILSYPFLDLGVRFFPNVPKL